MHRSPWIPTALCLCLCLCLSLAAALPAVALAGVTEVTEVTQVTQDTQDRPPKTGAIAAIAPRPLTTCPTFQPIACGQTIDGSLAPSDCTLPDGTAVDYYQFAGTNGEAITATLTTSAFPPFLELLDPNGGIKTSNSSGAPGTVQVPFGLDSTGNWSLAVTNNASTPQYGAYTINLACGGAAPTCKPNDITLCVGNGRFSVQASFDAGGGNSGLAHAVPLTGDTGYLWFFNQSNVEVVVKVLNGCSLNSKYWVFAGGLTNVKVTMTVTDVQAKTTKTYHNPARTTFQPIQDTSAFATCP
jgi:hypothetical protein